MSGLDKFLDELARQADRPEPAVMRFGQVSAVSTTSRTVVIDTGMDGATFTVSYASSYVSPKVGDVALLISQGGTTIALASV